ncbi:MAG: TolC family protein [bacterium]
MKALLFYVLPIIILVSCFMGFIVSDIQAADLAALLSLARNNPAIREAQLLVDAAKSKSIRIQTLPDPMLEFGYSNMMDLVGPTIMVQQAFPFPGKLQLMGKAADSETIVLEQSALLTELQIIAETKRDYYTLFYITKSLEIIERTKSYLELMEKTAAARYATGLAPQTDLLKVQTELSMLQEQRIMFESQKETRLAKIKRQDLGLSLDTEINLDIPQALNLSSIKYKYEQLQDIALATSPRLRMNQVEIAMQSNEVDLAKREYNPDFIASFEFMNPQKSFIREYTAKFGIMLPLYKNKKQKYALLEAEKKLAAQKEAYETAKQNELFMLKSAYQMLLASEKLAKLYKTTIIPQTRLTFESALVNYQVGKIDTLMMLDNIKNLLINEQKYYEQVGEFYKAKADIELTIGKELLIRGDL